MLPGVSGLPILACACVIRPPFCGHDQLMGLANKPATPMAAANPNRTNRVFLCMGPSRVSPTATFTILSAVGIKNLDVGQSFPLLTALIWLKNEIHQSFYLVHFGRLCFVEARRQRSSWRALSHRRRRREWLCGIHDEHHQRMQFGIARARHLHWHAGSVSRHCLAGFSAAHALG